MEPTKTDLETSGLEEVGKEPTRKIEIRDLKFNLADPISLQAMINICINKELEKYNTTIHQVIKEGNGMVDDTIWFEYYVFETKEEYSEWTKFVYNLLRKQTIPQLTREYVNYFAIQIISNNALRKSYERQKPIKLGDSEEDQPKEEDQTE